MLLGHAACCVGSGAHHVRPASATQSTSGNDYPPDTFLSICALVTGHFKSRVPPPAINVTYFAPPRSIQNFTQFHDVRHYSSKLTHIWTVAVFVTNLSIRTFVSWISTVCLSVHFQVRRQFTLTLEVAPFRVQANRPALRKRICDQWTTPEILLAGCMNL
jgi:hypothetical protein